MLLYFVADDSEDDSLDDDLVRSLEIDPCIFTNELR
jgi:hypothetical protein